MISSAHKDAIIRAGGLRRFGIDSADQARPPELSQQTDPSWSGGPFRRGEPIVVFTVAFVITRILRRHPRSVLGGWCILQCTSAVALQSTHSFSAFEIGRQPWLAWLDVSGLGNRICA
jgi:hypothetical protein